MMFNNAKNFIAISLLKIYSANYCIKRPLSDSRKLNRYFFSTNVRKVEYIWFILNSAVVCVVSLPTFAYILCNNRKNDFFLLVQGVPGVVCQREIWIEQGTSKKNFRWTCCHLDYSRCKFIFEKHRIKTRFSIIGMDST